MRRRKAGKERAKERVATVRLEGGRGSCMWRRKKEKQREEERSRDRNRKLGGEKGEVERGERKV